MDLRKVPQPLSDSVCVFRPLLDLCMGLPTKFGPLYGSSDHFRTSAKVPRPLPDLWEGPLTTHGPLDNFWTSRCVLRPILDLREGLPTTSRPTGSSLDHFRTFGSVPQPLPYLWERTPTNYGPSGGPPTTFGLCIGLPTNFGPLYGSPEHFRTSGWVPRPLTDHWEGTLTTSRSQ